jgi:thioredoxin reductase (NADPH)
MTEHHTYDVIIIGGGPAGASAALYTARLKLKTVVLDKSIQAGALGLTGKVGNYPGIAEDISGAELVERIREHARKFRAEFHVAEVRRVDLTPDPKQVVAKGEGDAEVVYQSRAVILATGAMGSARKIPGEQELLGNGVSYCAYCDGFFFRGKSVLVVGSNQHAVEQAHVLTKFADKVYFALPREDLVAEEEDVRQLLDTGKVELMRQTQVKQILGDGEVEAALLSRGGKEEKLPVDGVFVYTFGHQPVVGFLGGTVPTRETGCVIVDEELMTGVPGVFACGDLLCGNVEQAVVAAAQGVTAALGVDKYLRKRTRIVKDYK